MREALEKCLSDLKETIKELGWWEGDYPSIKEAEAALSTKQEGEGSAPKRSSVPAFSDADLTEIVEQIVRDVSELPDRTSPDDAPNMMLVSGDELAAIVSDALLDAAPSDEHSTWRPMASAPVLGAFLAHDDETSITRIVLRVEPDNYVTVDRLMKFNATRWKPLPAPPQAGLVAGAEQVWSAVIRASEHPSSPVSPTPEERDAQAQLMARAHSALNSGFLANSLDGLAIRNLITDLAVAALKRPADVAGEEQK